MRQLRRKLCRGLVAGTAALAFSATAQVTVTKDFTGIWDQTEQESQGFVVQIVGLPDGSKSGVAYWFTYDENGNQIWLVGQGPVAGNALQLEFLQVTGPTFLEPSNPTSRTQTEWGSGSVTFDDCDRATVDIDDNNAVTGTGLRFSISRLSDVFSTDCSGGISDDIPPGTELEIQVDLVSTGVVADVSGEAQFEISGGAASFEVEVEDLELGDYDLVIDGAVVAQITVTAKGNGSEGELEFRSPAESGFPLLTFDPRGSAIEIASNGVVLLTSNPLADNPGAVTQDIEIDIDLANTGVFPDATGEAEYEAKRNKETFEVKVKKLPEGAYGLLIGGANLGTIDVVTEDDGDTVGKIKFRNPASPGQNLLDFDPRSMTIDVVDGAGTVLLTTDLPGTGGDGPDVDNPDDDDNDDGTDDDDELSIRIDLNNGGPDADASGSARFSIETDEKSFTVEVDDLDEGNYDLRVGDIVEGVIEVKGNGKGRVKFEDPVEDDDDLLLSFDPRGQNIAVEKDGVVLLQAQFPN